MSEAIILQTIETNKDKYIQFFRDLLQIKSVNPPGNEEEVAIKINEFLKESAIKADIFSFGEKRANINAYLNNNFSSKILLYNSHMDVVPPGNEQDWSHPPFSAHMTKKKIYGRGTTDTKCSLTAMTIALKILKQLKIKTKNNLILNAVADEEVGGMLGTGNCIKDNFENKSIKPSFTIVGEPTGFGPLPKAIILGEKGRMVIKLITVGISGHASAPILGKNAITMMSEIINNLYRLKNRIGEIKKIKPPISQEKLKQLIATVFPNRQEFEKILKKQPLLRGLLHSLTEFTQSLNMINGGIKDNVIPDRCEATIDIRLLPNQTPEITMQALKGLIISLGYDLKYSLESNKNESFVYYEVIKASEASFWQDWEKSLQLKEFFTIVKKAYNEKPFYSIYPASSDAHYFRNNGFCPQTILFGPGNAMTAHAVNENIEIEDFINSIKVYTLFAYDFLKKSD